MSPLISPDSPPNGRKQQIQRMLPRHFKMADLHVAGLTNRSIAEVLGCTPASVGIVLRSPIVKKEIQVRLAASRENPNGTIHQEIEAADNRARNLILENAPKAAATLVELLDCDDASVQLRASGSILDRAIGKPESEHAAGEATLRIEIDSKDATLIMIALKESKESPSDGQVHEPTADRQDANSSDLPEQADVHQTPQHGAGFGHRQAQAQAPQAGRTLSQVKIVKNLSQLNGGKDTPPTNEES